MKTILIPRFIRAAAVAAALLAPAAAIGMGKKSAPSPSPAAGGSMLLATTTSTADSGLLDALVPAFTKKSGIEVKVIAVGTGAALRMGAEGNADAVLAHAPDAEKPLVASGDLVEGRRVMHNDFLLVGPMDDPAGVKTTRSLDEALTAIAKGAVFVSRGDDSGTHKMELALWKAAGVDSKQAKREETGQGMGATLNVADQKRGYTLVDRGTWLSMKGRLKLQPVSEGDPRLLNVYSVYVVSPVKHPKVKAAAARAFVEFLVAPETQKAIGEFKKAELGQSLFVPDALPGAPAK